MRRAPHRPGFARVLALALALCTTPRLQAQGPAPAAPRPERAAEATERTVTVTVVEVAGEQVYVTPGSEAGLRRGDVAVFGKQRCPVVAVSGDSAVIEPGASPPGLGAEGRVLVRDAASAEVERLPAPKSLEVYQGQWPRARVPSLDQQPRAVPLGPMRRQSRAELLLSAGGAAVVPLSGPAAALGRGQVRGRLHYEPVADVPLAFDADVTGQAWFAGDLASRPGSATRFPVFVRQLSASYGRAGNWNASLGRLRYASEMLGMIDGARAEAPIASGFSVAAFGGTMPDPLDGLPSLGAQRFGGELAWENADLDLRPRVVVGGHGSYFDGGIDERRMSAVVNLYPDFGLLGAHAELSFLDANNPWNASQVQVLSAGVDGRVELGKLDVGGRFDLRTPERSRWLASFLPAEWLCAPASPAGAVAGTCAGNELYYGGTLDARVHTERLLFSVGGTADGSRGLDVSQLGGFTNLRILRVWRTLRVDTGLNYYHGSLSRGGRALLGVGGDLARGLVDLSVYYQPAYLTYKADIEHYFEHGVGAAVLLVPGTEWDFSLNGDFITGRDLDMVLVQAFVNYRPRL